MLRIKHTEHREDNYRHKGMRRRLMADLRRKGIKNEAVLQAMEQIPRHYFGNSAFAENLYEDKAFPIAADQTISQPYTVAFMTDLLRVRKGQKILEIGTGSGYQAWVLFLLGAEIHTIERQEELYEKTTRFFKEIGVQGIQFYLGDGTKGLPAEAPFDRIIVTAGAPIVPTDLLQQLKIGGIMVIPVGEEHQVMRTFVKTGENEYEEKAHGDFRFVPVLEGVQPWKK